MALFTIYNAVKPNKQLGDKTIAVSTQGGTITPIRAINIAPITSPTKVDKTGPSTVITIKSSDVATLNSASINASLNAALSNTSLNTSPTSTSFSTKTSNDSTVAEAPMSMTDISLNDSSQSDSSPGKFTHSEPWQKAEVWRYFSLTEDPINGRRTICKLCGKGLSYNVRTTSTMRNHMKKKHPEIVIHNIMKPRRPRVARTDFLPSYIIGTAGIGNKEEAGAVTVKEEPVDKDDDEGITSEYIDNILGNKQTGGSSIASAVASAKGTTLSQALAQARALPMGRSVLRTIRPAPPKSNTPVSTSSNQTVTVRAVSSQPQFTVQAPAGAVQPAFPGLTPILTAAPQGSSANTKVTQAVQITRQPPPLRPAPNTNARTNPIGTLAIPLTVGGNVMRPLLITPQRDSTGPQITQTFSLRDVVGKQANFTSTPVATGNKRSRTPIRIGPASPIVISPTPSPDVDDDESDVTPGSKTQPEFKSWRQKQSGEKKELVNRLRDTLFKFCEENLEYSNCLHIRGDVLVIYDDNSLSAEFDKHLHGDQIADDKKARSQNEAVRAKALANKNIQQQTSQPIIQSVTSLATVSGPTTISSSASQLVTKTTSAQKRAAGLDRILGSWYSRPEEGSNESDAESTGVNPEDPGDTDWFPPAKKARGMKRKSAVPTRIIKQSQLVLSDDEDMQEEETSSVNSQSVSVNEAQNEQDFSAEGSPVENRTTNVIPITIAPETDDDDDEEEEDDDEEETNETADNTEETSEINGAETADNTEETSEMNGATDSDNEEGDVLMIDETDKHEQTKEGRNNKGEESLKEKDKTENTILNRQADSHNSDGAALRNLVNIVNEDSSKGNENKETADEESEHEDNDTGEEKVEEKSVENEQKIPKGDNLETDERDSDDEFSDDDEDVIVPEENGENDVDNEEDDGNTEAAILENGNDKSEKDNNDNEKSSAIDGKTVEMVNGNETEKEQIGIKDGNPRERSNENNKKQSQFRMKTRKKSVDSRTAEVRKSTETNKLSPGKAKVKQDSKVQKLETKQEKDSRIAPVERPNTRRLSRRITREDDDFVT